MYQRNSHIQQTSTQFSNSTKKLLKAHLYWRESERNITSRWVLRESNSMFPLRSDKDLRKQECIPVGCIPDAH